MPPSAPRRPKLPDPKPDGYYRNLGEACRELALDAHGMRCPVCPLKVLCTSEARWLVPRTPRPRYLI